MANRHLARSIVLQSLFEWDFAQKSDSEAKQILQQNLAEFAPNMDEHSFADSLFLNIIKKRADLDSVISKAAPDWPLDKISCADRNVLRVGLYELLKKINPDVRFMGADWKDRPNYARDELPNMKVIYNSREHNYSSTNLRDRIKKC